MIKKTTILLFIFTFSVNASLSCDPLNETISCGFSNDIIICLMNNSDEIETQILFETSKDEDEHFSAIENDFIEYFTDLLSTEIQFNKTLFIEKYTALVNNIPDKLNRIFSDYSELGNIGYRHYINYVVFFMIILCENIQNGKITHLLLMEYINIENITKIKKVFNEKDVGIVYDNKDFIIEKILEF